MNIRILFLMFLLVIAVSLNCIESCNPYNVQEIDGLTGGNAIVAWATRCGATLQNSVSVTWKKEGLNLRSKRGEIFEAINGDKIIIEKISADTVMVYYWAWDVDIKKEYARGITFIYEVKELEFFKTVSSDTLSVK